MEPFIGEIKAYAFNRIPKDWEQCNGQLLNINDNPALFSLIGDHFGGDGRNTFGLPDLRGRTIVGWSDNFPYMGMKGGAEDVILSQADMPAHRHTVATVNDVGSGFLNNEDDYFAQMSTQEPPPRTLNGYSTNTSSQNTIVLNNNSISYTGNGQAHNNMMPYQVLTWCISLKGIYPQRS